MEEGDDIKVLREQVIRLEIKRDKGIITIE
jgi:hypothetical protein